MLSSNTTSIPSHNHIYFRYQSHSITFAEWIKLVTVCLAPLITHVAFGYGTPVILSQRRPNLLDRLTQFNPITIVWRYYAIVNRRIRAYDWDRIDMVTSNAIFWDGNRWDGSEQLMLQSRQWVTKLPQQSRVDWLSSSMLATVAMTAQGIGAVVLLVQSLGTDWTVASWGFPDIFNYLAVLSFSRLPASLWLSDEGGFEAMNRQTLASNELTSESLDSWMYSTAPAAYCPLKTNARMELSEPNTFHDFQRPIFRSRLRPSTAFAARLWAVCCILGWIGGLVIGIYASTVCLGPRPFLIITQLSTLCISLYYLTLFLCAGIIIICYILKDHAGNTVLPCMNTTWYKWLNVVMILLALLMFITSALEMTILPNGKITTYTIPPL